MIRGEAWYMVRELLRQGLSISEIARRTGYDRKTIRKLRDAPGHPGRQRRRLRGSCLDAYKPYLEQRLAVGVLNAVKLYGEIQRQGYGGRLTLVRDFVRARRPCDPVVVERFETPPGHQAQVDWASCGRIWHKGAWRPLSAFVLTLAYSRRQYVEFTVRQDTETFLRCHLHAFHYFGGVPAELLYDNLKTAVLQRDRDGRVHWNPRLRDFADYYGFVPRACQPYRAQTKGKVERGIGYLRGNFLLGLDLSGHTLESLNAAVLAWLRETADVRLHGTLHERPLDRWPAEQAALHPLAARDYDTSYVSQRLVSREGYLAYRGCRYAIPPQYAGQLLVVKEGPDGRVRFYAGADCVAEQPLAAPTTRLVTWPEHATLVRQAARQRNRRAERPTLLLLPPPGTWPAVEVRPLTAYDIAVERAQVGGS
jgi:transposase